MNVKNGGDTVELKEGDQAEPGRGGLGDEAGSVEQAPSQMG